MHTIITPDDIDYLQGRAGKPFIPPLRLIHAASAAMILGRPLLLSGEPGCGKTDFAFALARWLDGAPDWAPEDPERGLLECYVRSESKARDLLYHYDSLKRFGDAHHGDSDAMARTADPRCYIELRPLGVAIASARRRVVLIDEIDKARRDLPNDLLRELDQGQFEISEIDEVLQGEVYDRSGLSLQRVMGTRGRAPEHRPVVVITSNGEHQLPNAFLRRCVYCHVPFPDTSDLNAIVSGWLGQPQAEWQGPLRVSAVEMFSALRARETLKKKPSTTELLEWVTVLESDATDPYDREMVQGYTPGDRPSWSEVPHLGCLIKLFEDWRDLERAYG
ncbi:MAG: AAA family ATPase [Bradymonadia bacterium]